MFKFLSFNRPLSCVLEIRDDQNDKQVDFSLVEIQTSYLYKHWNWYLVNDFETVENYISLGVFSHSYLFMFFFSSMTYFSFTQDKMKREKKVIETE